MMMFRTEFPEKIKTILRRHFPTVSERVDCVIDGVAYRCRSYFFNSSVEYLFSKITDPEVKYSIKLNCLTDSFGKLAFEFSADDAVKNSPYYKNLRTLYHICIAVMSRENKLSTFGVNGNSLTVCTEETLPFIQSLGDSQKQYTLYKQCSNKIKLSAFDKMFNVLPMRVKSPKSQDDTQILSDVIRAKQEVSSDDTNTVFTQSFKGYYTFNRNALRVLKFTSEVVYNLSDNTVTVNVLYPVGVDKQLSENFRKCVDSALHTIEKTLNVKLSQENKEFRTSKSYYTHCEERFRTI